MKPSFLSVFSLTLCLSFTAASARADRCQVLVDEETASNLVISDVDGNSRVAGASKLKLTLDQALTDDGRVGQGTGTRTYLTFFHSLPGVLPPGSVITLNRLQWGGHTEGIHAAEWYAVLAGRVTKIQDPQGHPVNLPSGKKAVLNLQQMSTIGLQASGLRSVLGPKVKVELCD